VVILIEGRAAKDVSPILFGCLLPEAAWTVSSVESLVARPGVPVIVAKFDDIHLTIIFKRLRASSLACQSIESNVCWDQVSFIMRNVWISSSCICDVSWVIMSLVTLLPLIDSDASLMSQ
jgi:hypothetical protein